MARTNEQRLEALSARLESARHSEARARKAGTGYGNATWADHFEGVALALEQKIYELKLEMEGA